jgi:glycosyltransferase involved in cell wall biosynthesis
VRVLNVIMCLDPVAGGGAVERVYRLSRQLAIAGEDCTVLTTRQGWSEEHVAALTGVKVEALQYLSERYKLPLGQGRWLRRNLARFDVVHLALNWTVITARTYVRARRVRKPYVISAMGWLAIGGRSRVKKRLYRALVGRRMVCDAACCVAITRREVDDYLAYGADPSRIALIPNGVDPAQFEASDDAAFRTRFGLDDRRIVLFIGRFDPIKGPDLLIRAFGQVRERFPRHQLVLFGNDGGFLTELRRMTASFGLDDAVSFFRPIYGVEKSWAYHAADLFVVPSRYDTMTIVALEAATSGAPVLITEACDFPAIEEGGAGRVVGATVPALAEALTQMLSSPSQLAAMAARAKTFATEGYSWPSIAARFQAVFARVAGSEVGAPMSGAGTTIGADASAVGHGR